MARPRRHVDPDGVRLLAFLRDAAPGPRRATVASNARMAGELGCSLAKAKAVKQGLLDEGLLEAHHRFAENGAQLESAYRLTRKGRRALESAAAGAPAGKAPDPADDSG